MVLNETAFRCGSMNELRIIRNIAMCKMSEAALTELRHSSDMKERIIIGCVRIFEHMVKFDASRTQRAAELVHRAVISLTGLRQILRNQMAFVGKRERPCWGLCRSAMALPRLNRFSSRRAKAQPVGQSRQPRQ